MEPEDPDDVLSSYDTNCSIIVTQMAKQGNMETPTGRYSEHFVLYKSSKFLCPLQQQCKNKRHLQWNPNLRSLQKVRRSQNTLFTL